MLVEHYEQHPPFVPSKNVLIVYLVKNSFSKTSRVVIKSL